MSDAPQSDDFTVYEMADGSLIWGEYQFATDLDGFEERDEEVRLIKRTYRLISEEEIVLPDPYPIGSADE
jgi:hypothetical protein